MDWSSWSQQPSPPPCSHRATLTLIATQDPHSGHTVAADHGTDRIRCLWLSSPLSPTPTPSTGGCVACLDWSSWSGHSSPRHRRAVTVHITYSMPVGASRATPFSRNCAPARLERLDCILGVLGKGGSARAREALPVRHCELMGDSGDKIPSFGPPICTTRITLTYLNHPVSPISQLTPGPLRTIAVTVQP